MGVGVLGVKGDRLHWRVQRFRRPENEFSLLDHFFLCPITFLIPIYIRLSSVTSVRC